MSLDGVRVVVVVGEHVFVRFVSGCWDSIEGVADWSLV